MSFCQPSLKRRPLPLFKTFSPDGKEEKSASIFSTCRFVIHQRNSSQLRAKFVFSFFLSNSSINMKEWNEQIFSILLFYIYSKGEGSVLDFIGRDNLFLDPYFVSIGVRLPCG